MAFASVSGSFNDPSTMSRRFLASKRIFISNSHSANDWASVSFVTDSISSLEDILDSQSAPFQWNIVFFSFLILLIFVLNKAFYCFSGPGDVLDLEQHFSQFSYSLFLCLFISLPTWAHNLFVVIRFMLFYGDLYDAFLILRRNN